MAVEPIVFAMLDEDGLSIATQQEVQDYYQAVYQDTYGADINLGQSTPDGQMMMIQVQAIMDLLNVLLQVYNSMDPDLAVGNVLDQRCSINGIQRQGGTYTVTNISISVSQALNLTGVDQEVLEPYTVKDNEGNEFELLESTSLPSAGVYVRAFRSKVPGQVLTTPNTITVPVTIVLGVTAVNNPSSATSIGENEETDAEYKIRRQQSVALSSQGYLDGLLAALENITGIGSVNVYENVTGITDGDGIPSHSIWVIVSGTASPASIANAIYTKRNAGCGMRGDQTYSMIQSDGSDFIIRWDNVEPVDLFIKFTATSLDGVNAPNISAIREQLPTIFVPVVYGQVNINELATKVQEIDPNTLITNAGFSTTSSGSYTTTLLPSSKKEQFVVSEENIIIIPIILLPSNPDSVTSGVTIQFSALGGYGTYTFSLQVNNSSGSINSSSGLYTAGGTPATDTVRVTDSLGNFTDVNVTVT